MEANCYADFHIRFWCVSRLFLRFLSICFHTEILFRRIYAIQISHNLNYSLPKFCDLGLPHCGGLLLVSLFTCYYANPISKVVLKIPIKKTGGFLTFKLFFFTFQKDIEFTLSASISLFAIKRKLILLALLITYQKKAFFPSGLFFSICKIEKFY